MHQEPQIDIPDQLQPDRGRFNFALILAAAALLIVVAALFFWPGRQSPPGAAPLGTRLAFGPAEQAYAPKMQIENITLSRAENFLHQELTIQFSDEMNQIALRETRPVLAPGSPPLAPAERRTFEVSFEHIPSSWNRQTPLVLVTGMQF
jgi:hypothetical protein